MTKAIKKLLSMVLICTMLASLGIATTVFAASDFNLAVTADGANVPVGMKVILEATNLPSDAASIEVFNANGNKVSSADVTGGMAAAECLVAGDDNVFTAKALDASGNVLAESNSVTVSGYREKVTHTRWDIDFTKNSIGAHRWGGAYVELKDQNGSTASSNGDTFTAHTGNTSNTITTEDTGDANYGVAMKLAATDNSEVQLNEFYTRLSGDVIKYEFDYKIGTLPTAIDGTSGIVVMWPVMSDGSWLTHLGVSVTETETAFCAGKHKMYAQAGRWYNIKCYVDTVNAVMAYYINGICLGSIAIPEGITSGTKFVSKLNKAAGASVWIDNIKIQSALLSYGLPSFAIGSDIGGKLIPAGMSVNADATLLPDEATSVKFYALDAEDNIVKTYGSANAANNVAKFAVELSLGANKIYAEAFDSANNIVAKSNVINVNGCYENITETRWNIDFSSHSVAAHRWGAPYYQINDNATNAAASSSGNTLTCHSGSASNTISTEDTGDASYGNAMKFVANDTAQVQLNEFHATPVGDVIKYELDYKLLTLPNNNDGTATINILEPVLNNGVWFGSFNMIANGDTLEFARGEVRRTAQLGTWYNIKIYADVVNCVATYYIDDVYFASMNFSSGATGGTKFVSMLKNAPGASCYIDNIKVQAATVSVNPPSFDIVVAGAEDHTLGGSTVMLNMNNLPETTACTVLYASDAEGKLGAEIARTQGKTISTKLAYGNNYFAAVAYTANNEIAGESEAVNVIGYVENVIENKWDLDFEDEYAAAHRWGVPYVQIFAPDGNILWSGGDQLYAHTGSASNTITSEPTGDAKYGNALKFTVNDTAKVQLNEFGATPSGDVIKYEYDYKIDSLPSNSGATIEVMQPVMAEAWLTSLKLGYNDSGSYFYFEDATKTVELGKWYNIKCYVDTVNNTYAYFIDDVCLAAASVSADLTAGKKIVSFNENATGLVSWIDNFKVQVVTTSLAKMGIASVKFVVNDNEVEAPAAGNLKVLAKLNNDGNENAVALYVAVYDDDELADVKIATYTFAENEITHTFDAIDMGTLSGTEKVKVMLWKNGSVKPIDVAAVLE